MYISVASDFSLLFVSVLSASLGLSVYLVRPSVLSASLGLSVYLVRPWVCQCT